MRILAQKNQRVLNNQRLTVMEMVKCVYIPTFFILIISSARSALNTLEIALNLLSSKEDPLTMEVVKGLTKIFFKNTTKLNRYYQVPFRSRIYCMIEMENNIMILLVLYTKVSEAATQMQLFIGLEECWKQERTHYILLDVLFDALVKISVQQIIRHCRW